MCSLFPPWLWRWFIACPFMVCILQFNDVIITHHHHYRHDKKSPGITQTWSKQHPFLTVKFRNRWDSFLSDCSENSQCTLRDTDKKQSEWMTSKEREPWLPRTSSTQNFMRSKDRVKTFSWIKEGHHHSTNGFTSREKNRLSDSVSYTASQTTKSSSDNAYCLPKETVDTLEEGANGTKVASITVFRKRCLQYTQDKRW